MDFLYYIQEFSAKDKMTKTRNFDHEFISFLIKNWHSSNFVEM